MDTAELSARESSLTWSRVAEEYRQSSAEAAALAYLLTGSQETAEDLVQDAFIRLAGRFRHIRNPDQLRGYLRRTVINLHLSRLRRLRLERAFLRRESIAQTNLVDVPDLGVRDELVRALQAIPARQQVAVVLRHCLDFSEAQVAEAMGCSTSAARNLVAHGIRRLRGEVGRDV
jgi:RNA polymerase sigma factor (sigma-70 family)